MVSWKGIKFESFTKFFLLSDGYDHNVYCHISDVVSPPLERDELVRFRVVETSKGPKAVNVESVE